MPSALLFTTCPILWEGNLQSSNPHLVQTLSIYIDILFQLYQHNIARNFDVGRLFSLFFLQLQSLISIFEDYLSPLGSRYINYYFFDCIILITISESINLPKWSFPNQIFRSRCCQVCVFLSVHMILSFNNKIILYQYKRQ